MTLIKKTYYNSLSGIRVKTNARDEVFSIESFNNAVGSSENGDAATITITINGTSYPLARDWIASAGAALGR